jgi:cytochrome c556
MRRFATYVIAVTMLAGAALSAQQKITTPEELDKTMKTVGSSQQTAGKAIGSMSYAEARKSLAAVKAALTTAETFWVTHKKDDAVKMNKEVIANLDKLDALLAAPTVDQQGALAALKGAGCGNCHKAYREGEPGNYSLRAGTI